MTEKSSMSIPPAPSKSIRFNPPPNWPAPPPGWTPSQGWAPHPSWPPPPAGWQLWIADPGAASAISGAGMGAGARRSRRVPRWVILAAAVVVGLVIANVTHGIFGHLIALLVWAGAAWSCVRPARARTASAARTWARIGVAACACLAVGAASLAIAGATADSGNQSDTGSITPVCYLTITGAETVYVAIEAKSDDCQRLAFQVQQVARGGTVSTDSAKPFPTGSNAVCMGLIDSDPATVVAPDDDDGGMCSALGFGATPLQLPPPGGDPDRLAPSLLLAAVAHKRRDVAERGIWMGRGSLASAPAP